MVLLITGAGRGLGLEMTKQALERGHDVIAGCRRESAALEELKAGYGAALLAPRLDVTSADSVMRAVAETVGFRQSIDCLINNAGVLHGREDRIETLDINAIRLCMETNVYGAIRVIQAFLPFIRGGGKIINMSSKSASYAGTHTYDYPYCISKIALNMVNEKLAAYLRERDILAAAVHPGWIRTDMGGGEAPVETSAAASDLLDLVEGKTKITATFVDRFGEEMPW
jgi:NAD(P)-dependent dehydrogenase (short-subunit alcohol dehydrogenase family)